MRRSTLVSLHLSSVLSCQLSHFVAKTKNFAVKMKDFGKDGFFYFSSSLPKIPHFCQCLPCILMREVPTLTMCKHTNEGIPSTEHVQTYS